MFYNIKITASEAVIATIGICMSSSVMKAFPWIWLLHGDEMAHNQFVGR